MELELIGYVGVDSGQLLLCDPCYIDSEWKEEDFNGDNVSPKHNFSYKACAQATLSENGHGQLKYKIGHDGVGVAFRTAFGDGYYPVYAKYSEDGTLKSVEVVFWEDEEEDEDDDFKTFNEAPYGND